MDESSGEKDRGGRDDSGARGGGGASVVAPAAGGSPFALYKPGQGSWVRWSSAAGAAVIAVGGVFFVNEQLSRFEFSQVGLQIAQAAAAVVLLVVSAIVIFWLIGRKRSVVEFMVATEGEMKKVNWSSRREVMGATRVVIVTVFVLAFFLFIVDILFILFFSVIGVLRVDLLSGIFGSSS